MSQLLDGLNVMGGAVSSESLSAGPLQSRRLPTGARVALSCLLFTIAMLVAFPVFAYVGWRRSGVDGIAAAAVAALLCWASAGASLALLGFAVRGGQLVAGVLGGMLLRMAPPLIACFVFVSAAGAGAGSVLGDGGSLARAGAGGMILVYYLLALSVETLFSVRLAAPALVGKGSALAGKKAAEAGLDEKGSKQSAAAT